MWAGLEVVSGGRIWNFFFFNLFLKSRYTQVNQEDKSNRERVSLHGRAWRRGSCNRIVWPPANLLSPRLMWRVISWDGEYIFNAAVMYELPCLCIWLFSFSDHRTTCLRHLESPSAGKILIRTFCRRWGKWERVPYLILKVFEAKGEEETERRTGGKKKKKKAKKESKEYRGMHYSAHLEITLFTGSAKPKCPGGLHYLSFSNAAQKKKAHICQDHSFKSPNLFRRTG